MLYKNIMVYNKKCSSPNKKVMRLTSVFFVIICKNWLVPNTNEGQSWWWWYGSWIYNYLCNQCLSPLTLWVQIPLRRGVLDTTLCDKVCQWLAIGQWFSPGTLVSSTNKTDRHDSTGILLKVAFKHLNPNSNPLNLILYTKICNVQLIFCVNQVVNTSCI